MSCSSCGAALAEDQRYCLNCGQRRGDARVEFRRHLATQAVATKEPGKPANGSGSPAAIVPVAAGAQPDQQQPPKPQRDYAPLAAAGGIAVLGVMLLIGVLIGRGSGGDEQAAAPQVVTVPSAESSAGGDATAGAQEADGGGGGKSGAKAPGNKNAAKKDDVVAGGSPDTGNAPVASDETLEALQGKTGEEYSKESAKLPDEIATPGAPPPEDNKAPGGGSGAVTLE